MDLMDRRSRKQFCFYVKCAALAVVFVCVVLGLAMGLAEVFEIIMIQGLVILFAGAMEYMFRPALAKVFGKKPVSVEAA